MCKLIISALLLSYSALSSASFSIDKTGMVVPAGKSESITITNTSNTPIILFSTEDTEATKQISGISLFKLEPMVAKLEPHQSQIVRVFSKNKNSDVEQLGRLRFIEISDVRDDVDQSIVSTGYNISAIVKPKDLPRNLEPWKFLKVDRDKNSVYLKNPSSYVVKINSVFNAKLINGEVREVSLKSGYIMPNVSVKVDGIASNEFESMFLQPILYNGTPSDLIEIK